MDDSEQQRTDTLSMAIIGHLVGAKRDMSQIQSLLREAVDSLLEDTFAIRDACRMQQQAAIGDGGFEDWQKSVALSRAIDLRVDASLRHLQFQDMVSQLLDHIRTNLEAMESLAFSVPEWSNAAAGGSTDEPRGGGPGPAARSKPVQSHSMRAGDVDLF